MPVSHMQCPRCGSTMNHHSDKVAYMAAAGWIPTLAAIVEEMQDACPRCGYRHFSSGG